MLILRAVRASEKLVIIHMHGNDGVGVDGMYIEVRTLLSGWKLLLAQPEVNFK